MPPPDARVILVLEGSASAKTATVIRSDPDSGKAHLRFDVYDSLDVAPPDSIYRARIKVELPSAAETVPAIGDLLARIERAVARTQPAVARLPRLDSISMSSPLEIVLLSGDPLHYFVLILMALSALRKQRYESKKAKLEADGIALDNEAKRRSLHLMTDDELAAEIAKAGKAPPAVGDIVDALSHLGAEEASRGMTRRHFLSAAAAMLALPLGIVATAGSHDATTAPGPLPEKGAA